VHIRARLLGAASAAEDGVPATGKIFIKISDRQGMGGYNPMMNMMSPWMMNPGMMNMYQQQGMGKSNPMFNNQMMQGMQNMGSQMQL
jgi:hypothetical protein